MKELSFAEMEEGVYIVYNDTFTPITFFLTIRETDRGKTLSWIPGVRDEGAHVQYTCDYPNERHNVTRLTALAKRVYGFK